MDNAKGQLVDRLKTANSVLITVSNDPTVDQLAACIGLALFINKLEKHSSAVFSGKIPSTIEFLKPEQTLEKTPDSLRDFIIALDKNKADKLRYKVEDQMVKIFITPYKTSLSEKDIEFSQGDFNVELVIALGVQSQEELDQAIVAHGRILHDATVATLNTSGQSNLGSINWQAPSASSLCEIVTDLASTIGDNLIDEQIATALLTGIIAETDRFSNEKTSPQTMSISAKLMNDGANQQLVATNLNEPPANTAATTDTSDQLTNGEAKDGTLSIEHQPTEETTLPALEPSSEQENFDDDQPADDQSLPTADVDQEANEPKTPRLVAEPPSLGGTLTANSEVEHYDPSTDPLSNVITPTSETTMLSQDSKQKLEPISEQPPLPAISPPPETVALPQLPPQPLPPLPAASDNTTLTPPPPTWTPPTIPQDLPAVDQTVPAETQDEQDSGQTKTLEEIEQAVNSPHVNEYDVNDAREKVEEVLADDNKPDQALNAMPLGEPLHEVEVPNTEQKAAPETELDLKNTTGLDPSLFSEPPGQDQAPPVPPPINLPLDNNQLSENEEQKAA